MDDVRAMRLVAKFKISYEAAVKLVAAGLLSASPIRRATNKALLAAGLSRKDVAQIRLKRRK